MAAHSGDGLYPEVDPFEYGMLPVSGGHQIYYEQCGARDGLPVLFLHGGPGGGCSAWNRRLFDLSRVRLVLFDQRGCGRSTPHASLVDNTTWDLVEDIERLRRHLGVDRWLLFGGSWGSTLALAYAETHPDRAVGLVLRGVFLSTEAELEWFYRSGTRMLFPDAFAEFVAKLSAEERVDPLRAWHRRLTSADPVVVLEAARTFTRYEVATSRLRPDPERMGFDDRFAKAIASIEAHYFVHGSWLGPDQLLRDVDRVAHLPLAIVQGRYDAICPPAQAWALHRAWPGSTLRLIDDAGHSALEPATLAALMAEVDAMITRVSAAKTSDDS